MDPKAYDLAGPFMVNDITGGSPELLTLVARLNLPYIAMDSSADPVGFFERFAEKAEKFRSHRILDPGFGLETVEDNWRVLRICRLSGASAVRCWPVFPARPCCGNRLNFARRGLPATQMLTSSP